MEARATFGATRIAGGVLRTFVVAMLVALLVGGAGGYLARALTYSAPINATPQSQRPFVIEQPPYSAPSASPVVFPNPPRGIPGYY